MARIYTANAKEVTLAANTELFSLLMNTNNSIAIIRRLVISMTQVSLPIAQGLEFSIKRFNTATQNTSGSATTPQKEDPGDAASAATVYTANTALSTGTVEWEWDDGCYFFTGRDVVFAFNIVVPKTRLISVYCPNATIGSPTPIINAMLEWEESGV